MSTDGRSSAEPLPDVADHSADTRRALLDLAITAARVGTFDWDLSTGRLGWDDRLIELFGYERGQFDQTMKAFTARLHAEDRDRVAGLLQAAIDTGGDLSAEYRVLLPGGAVRWLAARGRALCDERGATVRVLGAAWDTTERRAGQERVAQLVEGMAVGFATLDRNWVITHVNAEAERIIGVPRPELLGRNIWERFPEAVGSEPSTQLPHRAAPADGRTAEAAGPTRRLSRGGRGAAAPARRAAPAGLSAPSTADNGHRAGRHETVAHRPACAPPRMTRRCGRVG